MTPDFIDEKMAKMQFNPSKAHTNLTIPTILLLLINSAKQKLTPKSKNKGLMLCLF